MVSEDPHGLGELLVLVILCAGSFLDICDGIGKEVCLIDILRTVEECEYSLESPACIYILLLERSEVSVLMLLILHEDVVTDLGVLAA